MNIQSILSHPHLRAVQVLRAVCAKQSPTWSIRHYYAGIASSHRSTTPRCGSAHDAPRNDTALAQPSLHRITGSALRMIVVLFKLRVVGLLLFAAVTGALLGSNGKPATFDLIILIITGGLAAAGASSLNQYLERQQDVFMRRTARRPLAMGAIAQPHLVLIVGTALVIFSSIIAFLYNPALGFFVAAGAVIYVGVYTIWLKPRTWLNIVIGGAAGSCAVLSGGAAVGAWTAPSVIALALLVFAWTPVHFWSLALAHRDDYAAAHVPMLPVVTTPLRAAIGICLHALASGAIALWLGMELRWDWLYLLISVPATAILFFYSARLLRRPDRSGAWSVFHISNLYLGVILFALALALAVWI